MGSSTAASERDGNPTTLWPVVTVCTLVYLLDGLVHSILGPIAPQMAAGLALTPD